MQEWIEVPDSKVSVQGPYECPCCGGHVYLDSTYIDEVDDVIECPYCHKTLYVP